MAKIRWGVLSTAKIARNHVIPAIQSSSLGEVVAICSRSEDQAQRVAAELDIERAHGSYEALLADPNIDAIYNPLPNHLHVPWSIKAMEAGKHVLVEKPMGLDAADAQTLLEASTKFADLKVMEAFMYRFHPQWQQIRELCQNTIGPVRNIQCEFSYNNRDASNIRNSADMGGGALMDIGCYGISLARFIYNAEPNRVCGHMNFMDYEVDAITSAIMEFEAGTASFSCSTKTEPGQWAKLCGEAGYIYIPLPFNPTADSEAEIIVRRGGNSETITLAPANQYRAMADHFCDAILHNKAVPTPLSDGVNNMKVLDKIIASAQAGTWLKV
ncbi:Gfo/Idh/MocA family protein [Gilvimarinus chinensis]|uniref:Gfo/Idh/MocA family protein n=1 Tax=Gilvimarinus chinensis TaxID=396005 RepID=UPI000375664C|nr:Gfo/Idh/MocA family oxidoreductase [Gilvimarinus chinensis]